MTKPIINSFSKLSEILIQQYERYLPTAFDGSLTILEKVNKIIEHLNSVGLLVNNVVEQWNEVMEWVIRDGLSDAVNDKLDEMSSDGTLAQIINVDMIGSLSNLKTNFKGNLVGGINENTDSINELKLNKSKIITSEVEPLEADDNTYWNQILSATSTQMKRNNGIDWLNIFPVTLEENIKDLNGNGLPEKLISLENRLTNIFKSVKDFGAVGDGVTNDTEAVQSAINSGFNIIFEKGKTYIVDNPIINGQNVVIYGNNATLKPSLTDSTCLLISASANNVLIDKLNFQGIMTTVDNDRCAGIKILSHSTNEGRSKASKNIEISRCNFLGNFIFSIIANGCTGLKIHDCFGTGNRYNASIQAGGYFILLQTCYDVEIYGNKAVGTSTDRHAVYVSGYTFNSVPNVNENVSIHDNIFDWSITSNTRFETVVTCRSTKNLMIQNNKFKGGYGGISIVPSNGHCENVIISGNILIDLFASPENEMSAISCALSDVANGYKCVNVKISDNVIRTAYLTSVGVHGISLIDTVNFEVTGNIVYIVGVGSYGLYLYQTTNGVLSDNTLNGGSKAQAGLCFIGVADIQVNSNNMEGYANKELYYGEVKPLRVKHGYLRSLVIYSNGSGGLEIRHDNNKIGVSVTSAFYGCDIKISESWMVDQYKVMITPVHGMNYGLPRSIDVVENIISFNILDQTGTQKPLDVNAMEFIVLIME